MRRSVTELKSFYAEPMGRAVRTMVIRQLVNAWGDVRDLDVLGIGYATPFLEPFRDRARRVVAVMPAAQGVETWPAPGPNLVCLADEYALPLPSALFDRVLVVHGLEESADPVALLAQVHRVLAPSGRAIIAVAHRNGLWAGAEATPFGHGQPFTRAQLETIVRDAELEPYAWSRALYAPPWPALAPYAELIEQAAAAIAPPFSGLILLEAIKKTFAVRPGRVRAPIVRTRLRPAGALSAIRKAGPWKGERSSP
jgi:SAM-dependent methyltransferase